MDKIIPFLIFALIFIVSTVLRVKKAAEEAERRRTGAGKRPPRPASQADEELREFLAKVTGRTTVRPPLSRPQPGQPTRTTRPAQPTAATDVSGDIERALRGAQPAPAARLGGALPSEERQEARPSRVPEPQRADRAPAAKAGRPRRTATRRRKAPQPARARSKRVREPETEEVLLAERAPLEPVDQGAARPVGVDFSKMLSGLSELQRAVVMSEILSSPVSFKGPR